MKTAVAPSAAEAAALLRIPAMDDPEALRRMLRNARKQGSRVVERAVFKRLCEVQPSAQPGTLEHDVWRSIHALEEMRGLSEQRAVRLSRTRQKIARDGETKTVEDLILRPEPSDGFHMLVDLEHPELLFEAMALRHPDRLSTDVLDAARSRIVAIGLDPDALALPQGA